MKLEDLPPLLGTPETEQLEYKRALPPPALVARQIAAFANTHGGWLVFGVEEGPAGIAFPGLPDDAPADAVVTAALRRLVPVPPVVHGQLLRDGSRLYGVGVGKAAGLTLTEDGTVYSRQGTAIRRVLPAARSSPEAPPHVEPPIVELRGVFSAPLTGATEACHALRVRYSALAELLAFSDAITCPSGAGTPPSTAHGRSLLRLVMSSLADTFEQYAADLLLEVHLADPRTLKSEQTLTANEILQCNGSIVEVYRTMATKRVSKLSRGGKRDFEEYFAKVLGTEVFLPAEQTEAERTFALRNLYTHANGIVDERFKGAVPDAPEVGDEHYLSVAQLCAAFRFFWEVVVRTDRKAASKYPLATSGS